MWKVEKCIAVQKVLVQSLARRGILFKELLERFRSKRVELIISSAM
jgi:hypothetical protein